MSRWATVPTLVGHQVTLRPVVRADQSALPCVEIRTDRFNRRSQAAIGRLNAQRDGVLRNRRIAADGCVRDIVVYGIVAPEWPGVRADLSHQLEKHA